VTGPEWQSIVAGFLGEVGERGRELVRAHGFGGHQKRNEIP
jgi:hypothetical protein